MHQDAPMPPNPGLTDTALRSVLAAAPDGILVVDDSGRVLFANPMIERLFEYGPDQLVGESVDQLLPTNKRAMHALHRARYIARPSPRPMGTGLALRGRRRSGGEFPLEISLSPVQDGGRTLVIAIVRDISERQAAAEELHRVRGDLALVDERERIARDLHDTVIQRLFAIGLSLQAGLAGTGASQSADRLDRAIDDIDDTIRDLRSAVFSLHSRRPVGSSLRDDVISIVHESARVLGFEPRVRFDGPVDTLASEPMREQLDATLREALSNVAKHASATGVDVEVRIEQLELVMRVVDNGSGIGASSGGGDGLGNMSERAESLRGRCAVTAPAGGGTTVEWRVPVGESARGR